MATIKDVASLAGVSTATVSRVINQTAWVEPVTRERVEKAMRDLNYRRNAAAIALAKRSAAREATRYLLANGHRRIACVTSDLPIIDRQERLDGYREALEEYGISPDPRWVISVPFNEEGGERAAHQLINSGLPLTAAVTFNDVMAAGIMRILHQRGVQLPQQLSIVGFDDVVLARYLYPALTTMHYPVEQMARCAAQLAIQLYQGITPPPSSNHFNAELVIRDSVAPYFSR
ncbi:LacI family DNA-binding transcriptional regulator [Salmonella enterica]|nr:LacI family DNA-binding transcriptional regulator [Salmonella enterica]ECH4261112.1 LacI family DNA-binding transcriptional regulator [Salmonella enterica]